MKINTIIYRHLLQELLPPFLINMVFFSFVFLMTQILEITNMVVNYNMGRSCLEHPAYNRLFHSI